MLGPAIRALADIVVAVTGGNLQPRRNKQPIEMWRSHNLKKDDILSFDSPLSGFRAYVAVGGGISVPPVMGSRSTNLPSGFGGLQGRTLEKNDILTSENHSQHVKTDTRVFNAAWIPVYPNNWSLRVIWGPQDDHFPDESRDSFLSAPYKMSSDSDRTGIRLAGSGHSTKTGYTSVHHIRRCDFGFRSDPGGWKAYYYFRGNRDRRLPQNRHRNFG